MRYFSMFSGIGGFELGIQQAHREPPWECVGYSEIDKYAIKIYERHFNHKNYGDATKIDTRELPDFDLLVGGFPCQAFSVAGKRKGFNDTRGTLFFEIARVLADKRPRHFILENVKGLLSHDKGKTFQTILGILTDLGYLVEWQVLNSKNFGVPQNRERVFIIGHLGGKCGRKVFPLGENGKLPNQEQQQSICREIQTSQQENGSNGDKPLLEDGEDGQLHYIGGITGKRDKWLKDGKNNSRKFSQGQRVYGTSGISSTLAENSGGLGGKTGLYAVPVLTPNGVYNGVRIRRLTPIECERLQGFLEVEKYAMIQICLDHQKNSVNAGTKNPKLQKFVGSVGRTEKKESVKSAEKNTNIKHQQTNKPVLPDVHIFCGENGVELLSQGKLLLNANGAEKKNWSHPHIKIDDFVRMLVGITSMLENATKHGEGGLHPKGGCLIVRQNGEKLVKLFGNGTMQPVGDVETDLIILKELLKSTTLDHLNTEISEQKLITLSSYVIRAINGFIPQKILTQDTFTVEIDTKVGYTYGISDTQRYKVLGNAVTTNVVQAIVERLE